MGSDIGCSYGLVQRTGSGTKPPPSSRLSPSLLDHRAGHLRAVRSWLGSSEEAPPRPVLMKNKIKVAYVSLIVKLPASVFLGNYVHRLKPNSRTMKGDDRVRWATGTSASKLSVRPRHLGGTAGGPCSQFNE